MTPDAISGNAVVDELLSECVECGALMERVLIAYGADERVDGWHCERCGALVRICS